MIAALARFVEAMREEGIVVSPAELIDAGRALDLVNLEQRSEVHSALKTTLAKDRRAAATFDRLFNRFFTPPRVRSGGPRMSDAEFPDLLGRGGGGMPPPDTNPPLKPRDQETQTVKAAPKPTRTPARSLKPPTDLIADLKNRGQRERELRSGKLRQAQLRQASSEGAQTDDPGNPIRRTLATRMTTDEERRIAQEVPRIIEALRLGVGRRFERNSSGRPWLRRALRQSIATGGVPFTIPARSPKRNRTRVVVLADVSFSVARTAGLFLWMAASFLKFDRRNRVLLFVDRPVDATEAIRRWAGRATSHGTPERPHEISRRPRPGEAISPRNVSFAELMAGLKDLNPDAASDYGTAFHALLTSPMRPRGRDTVLVILGDGRTNRFDPLPWTLDELSRGCRATLWLASEPHSRWGEADSALPTYLKYVDVVVEATDLAGLARGLAAVIRRL